MRERGVETRERENGKGREEKEALPWQGSEEKGVWTVWEGATQGRKEREDGETEGKRLHNPELSITSFYFWFWTVPSGIVSPSCYLW